MTSRPDGALASAAGRQLFPRKRAQLGGTTSLTDCRIALRSLIEPRKMIHGAAIGQFEAAFAGLMGVQHAISFSSGRVGLYGLLRALGVGQGDEVMLPVPTHVVVPNAIRYSGATPVYVDCTADTFNIDPDQAEERVTPRTRVLVLLRHAGRP